MACWMAAGYEISAEAFVEEARVVLSHQGAGKEGKVAFGLLHSCLAFSAFLKVYSGFNCRRLSKGWQRVARFLDPWVSIVVVHPMCSEMEAVTVLKVNPTRQCRAQSSDTPWSQIVGLSRLFDGPVLCTWRRLHHRVFLVLGVGAPERRRPH
jgi:hypothetical protein